MPFSSTHSQSSLPNALPGSFMRAGVIKAGIATERLKAARRQVEEWLCLRYKGGDRDRAIERSAKATDSMTIGAVIEARIATERLKDAYLGKVEAMDVVVEARIANERLKDASNKAPMTLTAR